MNQNLKLNWMFGTSFTFSVIFHDEIPCFLYLELNASSLKFFIWTSNASMSIFSEMPVVLCKAELSEQYLPLFRS